MIISTASTSTDSTSTARTTECILIELEGASHLAASERGDCLHAVFDNQRQPLGGEFGDSELTAAARPSTSSTTVRR